ncbi:hypothetical protein BGZ76_002025 [Entomortierella beljakovae]|nr:hypothetical protein BGZ76_002025 [Entomortierella beljakovae]
MASPSDSQKPTWLNQLPNHSIFELDENEYLEWARINNANKNTVAANQDSKQQQQQLGNSTASTLSGFKFGAKQKESFGLDDLQEDHQKSYQGLSCMVMHGQDLYVAVGRQVRHTSLAELKKGVENHGRAAATEYIDKKQHKVLKLKHIDFDIRRLVLNQEGRLMAIVGDEKIVIAALTKITKQDTKVVNCKSFVLGEFYHINKGPSKIAKVLWHPLSKGYSHVLVLTHDSVLRMYDVATNPDEPEQVFNFTEGGHAAGAYGLDIDNAASFCFGSKYSPWGQLSVYCLTEMGDVYMMCPIMPSNCYLDVSDLDDIRFQLEKHHLINSTDTTDLQQVRKDWLESLLETRQAHPFSDEVVELRNPVLRFAEVALQGPFLFQPAPIELEDDDNKASDILSLDTEAAEILAIAHSCGKVDICIAVDRPEPRWTLPKRLKSNGSLGDDGTEDEDDLPTLSVYESIDLGLLKTFGTSSSSIAGGYSFQEKRLSIPNHPVLMADPLYGDIFYVYHEVGAHCVSIRPWLEELTRIYQAASQRVVAGLDGRVTKFYDAKIKSRIGCIVTTRPTKSSIPAPIVGFVTVADAYLEYSLLLLTSSLQLIGLELMTRTAATEILEPLTVSQGTTTVIQKENEYQNSLTLPGFEKQGGLLALNGLPLQPKVVLPPGVGSAKIIVTEENLQFLGKMVQGYRESLREVYTACDIAQQRLTAQESEYTRQQQSVTKTKDRLQTMAKKLQDQVDRQDAQGARQRALMARADDVMQKLMESSEQELSAAEKEWGIDVARKEKLVKVFDERRYKIQAQYEILKRRLSEMQDHIEGSASASEGYSRSLSGSRTDSNGSTTSRYTSPMLGRQSVQRQAVQRYGSGQIQSVVKSLGDESQLLDTTIKMTKEMMSRLEVLSVSDNNEASS